MTEAETDTTANDKIIPKNICYKVLNLVAYFYNFELLKSHLYVLKGETVTELIGTCRPPTGSYDYQWDNASWCIVQKFNDTYQKGTNDVPPVNCSPNFTLKN